MVVRVGIRNPETIVLLSGITILVDLVNGYVDVCASRIYRIELLD